MPVVKGSDAVLQAFLGEEVETIFSIPGSHIFDLTDRFYGRNKPRLVFPKYEQGGSTMADAYGRLTGKPGVCLVTAGPGATNGLSGVAQAYHVGSPLVHVSGTVPRGGRLLELHGVDDGDFLAKVF
jgi:acetolactate synthase-1/2/3 large subunit